MLRKDRVLQCVLEKVAAGKAEGVTAQEVSDSLEIWRNDAAVELNKLVSEGILTRTGKKNVRFLPRGSAPGAAAKDAGCPAARAAGTGAADDNAFSRLVGSSGSLKYQIGVAKAAVSYPPFGLNMLITGSTGVGKTKFAHAIWEYANEIHAFNCVDREVPFVHFNCAEYADNPQLLLSNLFGYKKGAFTGALNDKEGLVEETDGGILFLDEIHCLSATSQELFFALLDTGFFRRIGDSVKREAHFMLIGATTKSISTALMDTFTRRMPVLIQIPSLSERPLNERPEFIKFFYAQEALHIGCPICIKRGVLNALLDYTSKVNLGTLKNTIQMSCAKAFLRSGMQRNGSMITITLSDLLFQVHTVSEGIPEPVKMKSDWFSEDMYVGVAQAGEVEPETPEFVDIYDLIVRLMDEGQKREMTQGELQQVVLLHLDGYFEQLRNACVTQRESMAMEGLISPHILPIAAELIGTAAVELHNTYPRKAPLLLGMHLNQYVDRVRSGNPALPPNIQSIINNYRKEVQFLETQRNWLSASLGVPVTDDEIGFLAIFLRQTTEHRQMPNVCITLCSCSEDTAINMGTYVSTLFSAHHIHSVNNRPTDTANELFERMCRSLQRHHGEKGNLIFTDLQQFSGMEEKLRQVTGVRCIVVPMLEIRLIMVACRITMTQKLPLNEIHAAIISDYAGQLQQFFRSTGVKALPPLSDKPETVRPRVIFTICVTGVGSAESIRELLVKKLENVMPISVIAVSSLDDVSAKAAAYGLDLKLIVGTVNPNIPGVPFLFADAIFTPNGIERIMAILGDWGVSTNIRGLVEQEPESEKPEQLLFRNFNTIAPSVDRDAGTQSISDFLLTIEKTVYKHRLPENTHARVFMHAAGMLERIAGGNTLEMIEEGKAVIRQNQAWFRCLSGILRSSFEPKGFPISDAECFYFMLTLPDIPDEAAEYLKTAIDVKPDE